MINDALVHLVGTNKSNLKIIWWQKKKKILNICLRWLFNKYQHNANTRIYNNYIF